jgi:hypothetical protein
VPSPWSYEVTDWPTGNRVADHVPIRCDSFTDGLGVANGVLTGTLPFADTPIQAQEALLPWRRVIWPCYGGARQPHGAFVVTSRQPITPKATGVEFTAERFDTVFNRRLIVDTLVFRQQDILTIARALIGYAVGDVVLPGLDPVFAAKVTPLSARSGWPAAAAIPWMTVDQQLYGPPLHDRLDDNDGYQAPKRMSVGDALTNLTELQAGFDYRIDYTRDPDTGRLGAHIRFGTPDLGRLSAMPLEWPGGNLLDWTFAVDTGDTETYSDVIGAQPEGQPDAARPVGLPAIDLEGLKQGWPLLMGSESSSASEQVTLNGRATQRLTEHWRENAGWTAKLAQDALGTYEFGDWPLMRVDHPAFGGMYGKRVRIVAHKVEPSRQGRAGRLLPQFMEV